MNAIILPLGNHFQAILSTILLVLLLPMAACGNASTIQEIDNFKEISIEMQNSKRPLLLAFRADYCTYCRQLENEYLIPMDKSSDYHQRVIIRAFNLGKTETVTDFSGEKISADDFLAKHGISITPTLVFLNATGTHVAEPLLGFNSPDFYGAYLENAIDTAHRAVQTP